MPEAVGLESAGGLERVDAAGGSAPGSRLERAAAAHLHLHCTRADVRFNIRPGIRRVLIRDVAWSRCPHSSRAYRCPVSET